MNPKETAPDVNRRDFLRSGSLATMMMTMGAIELQAEDKSKPKSQADDEEIPGAPVKVALIGLGAWGREILANLTRLPKAAIAAVCDTYATSLRRAADSVPQADRVDDYRRILENKTIPAVVIATPSHQHREIAVAALQAGKHVYCEAPLATTLEDARAIAKAAQTAGKQIFQGGLLLRTNPIHQHVAELVRTGALGKVAFLRAQFHKKQSWRRTAPNPDREAALNWRLNRETSPGLIGELGIHPLEVAGWFHKTRPVSVHGFASTVLWNDGRTVPDTIQAVVEFPGGIQMVYDATLANSFEGNYEVHCGADGAIVLRESRAWLVKEADAPSAGWEVHARKDDFTPGADTGIALVANASKLLAQGIAPADAAVDSDPPVYYALKDFLTSINTAQAPAAGYETALAATVLAIKANEAVTRGQKVVFKQEWFEL